MIEKTTAIKKQLGALFVKTLDISKPLYQLQMIREKIEGRGLQPFDKDDISHELGTMQRNIGELNSEMLRLYELLRQS